MPDTRILFLWHAKGETAMLTKIMIQEIQDLKLRGYTKSDIVDYDIVNNSWHIYHKDISTYAALSKAS